MLYAKTKKFIYIRYYRYYLLAVMPKLLNGIEVVFPLLVFISYALLLRLCYSIRVTINLKIVGSPSLIQIKNIIRKTWIEVVFPLLVLFLCTLSFYYSIRVEHYLNTLSSFFSPSFPNNWDLRKVGLTPKTRYTLINLFVYKRFDELIIVQKLWLRVVETDWRDSCALKCYLLISKHCTVLLRFSLSVILFPL